jgi:acetyl coenzyme A synthetase (ADP forming)-like protein
MSLDQFFSPQSVAVVGASRTKGKVGYEIFSALVRGGFPGKLYPVNPSADEVEGIKAYPDIKSLPESPDLVVVAVAAKFVAKVVRECGNRKVTSVVIISSGFKESGDEGAKLEQSVLRVARSSGIRIIGPNCIGVLSPVSKLNASFAGKMPLPGQISYFSQSGSLLAAIIDMANSADIGFCKLASIGNKMDVDEIDVITAYGEDEDTKVIAGYLETIIDGDAFISLTESISKKKPILLMKSGVTASGAKAASSHTGRMLGSEATYECVFERAGVIRCESIKAQVDFARAFATQPYPAGPNVAVIANAGGAGIMAADAIDKEDLNLAQFTPETLEELSVNISKSASLNNPVDLLGDALAERYEAALETILEDPNVDVVLVLLSPHAMTECIETANALVRVTRENPVKPVLACFLGASRVEDALKVLWDGQIPYYDSPESAIETIKAMVNYSAWRARPKRIVKRYPVNKRKVERIIRRHIRQGIREIDEMESKEILKAYGFVTPTGYIATTAEQAANIAQQIGYPVVLKIWSPDIIHKSEVGGVLLDLNSEKTVRDAFDLMMYRIPKKRPDANILGVFVQQYCRAGKEVILGMNRDPRFGPLMMFGMGGVLVERLKDVSFYPAPLAVEDARLMLENTMTYKNMTGSSADEIDFDVIADGLQRLSQLVTEFPQILEMDINPYLVGPKGATPIAVDARISVGDV